MKNILRTLICDDQVSLTLCDTTELVKEAVVRHALSTSSAQLLGEFLSVASFMSAALKEERGEISFSVKSDGAAGDINVSGNQSLHIRGYVDNACLSEREASGALGEYGALTVIRDDGYSRPFVGACAFPKDVTVSRLFEEYYRVSEQLPTYFATLVEMSDAGEVVFAGLCVLQPLPFADEALIDSLPKGDALQAIVGKIPALGLEKTAMEYFSAKIDGITWREATYTCHCSRLRLCEVLVSLGEEQMRQIIREDGELRVHCHYCNTDYVFTEEDADKIFYRKKKQ